jgi:hypothetical protein
MSRFCTQCGTENKDAAQFCKHCGVSLAPKGDVALLHAEESAGVIAQQLAGEGAAQETLPPHDVDAAAAAQQLAQQADSAARQERERAQRDEERRAATARLEAEIRARAEAAEAALFARSQVEPRPAAQRQAPSTGVRGSNAVLFGGIATVIIALALIGGGSLWWSRTHPQQSQTGALAAADRIAMAAGQSAPAAPAVIPAPVRPASVPQAAPAAAVPAERGARAAAQPAPKSSPESFNPAPTRTERPKPAAVFVPAPARQETPQPAQHATPAPIEQPAPVAPARTVGRVDALRAGLAACEQKGNFFTRQLCIQETRWKYCGAPLSSDQLWGKVTECPNSAQQHNTP